MKTCLIITALLLSVVNVQAVSLKTPAGNQLNWIRQEGWRSPEQTPHELLSAIAEHIGHEAEEKGQKPTRQQLLQAAAQRMAANELLLYHPLTGAWISFDFSPLRQGEARPTAESLELSARYALESLEQEEGVSALRKKQQEARLEGTQGTRRLTASYQRHGIPTRFIGLIGYVKGEWFFIYATISPENAEVATQIEELFAALSFQS